MNWILPKTARLKLVCEIAFGSDQATMKHQGVRISDSNPFTVHASDTNNLQHEYCTQRIFIWRKKIAPWPTA